MKNLIKSNIILIIITIIMFLTWLIMFYNSIITQVLITMLNPDIPYSIVPSVGILFNLILSFIVGINIGRRLK